jgi:phosphoribosylaminoimidazolecarboxamide formyltransferase/IMP cyclohydrolase
MAVTIKRALISVFDKTGLDVLAESLKSLGVTVLSTGGTAKKLRELGVEVVDVKDVTKYPEMLGELSLTGLSSL